jgi:PAS domain S-box-containing protein
MSFAILLVTFLRLRRETARRFLSEQAAKHGEESLARILMSIGDGVIATDPEGRVIRMNRVTEELTGWTAAAGIGQLVSEIFHIVDAETHEPIPDPVERVLHQRVPFGLERPWLLTRRDGSELPVTDSCAPVTDDRGVVQGAVLVFRDVSEAQRAKTFFRALVEKSSDGITLAAPDGMLAYASPAAARLLGCTAEAVVGTNVLDYAHPDDVEGAREDNRNLVESTGATKATERRVRRPDGTCSWIEVTGTNMVDNPAVGAIVRNMRDVTERKGAEGALRASEARFARLSESGLIGIALADMHGNVHDANDTYLRMLGYSRADLHAGNVGGASMTAPEWRSMDDRATERVKSTGVATPWEKELFRQDGSRVPVLVGAAMLDDRDCISFVVDLTDRKRSERTLRETQEQLRQAQKMDAVGRLAGGVAHDFNNMLSVILSYSQLLLNEVKPSDPMHADLDEIQRAGQRAAALTHQLLMFSRQQVIEPRVIDLNDVLSDMDRMLRRLLGEDIEVTFTKRSTAKVLVDPSGIEQVVMNLVVNARDAMPTGGKLTIETADVVLDEEYARRHVGVTPGPHVMLAVTDGGSGMDPATRERIFDPFFTTKEKGKGTGLGLSTVFGIATQSGGSVWVYSELGLGTTFKVYLPRAKTQARAPGVSMPPTTLHGTETILLVEDEDQVRAVARGILTRHGYKVIEAGTPGEALLSCEQHTGTIDLLLTDVVMPKMSGPELAKRLAVGRPEMRVLCMSGYTDDSIVRHGVLEAHFAFLQKPITPDTLTRKVREVLDAPS